MVMKPPFQCDPRLRMYVVLRLDFLTAFRPKKKKTRVAFFISRLRADVVIQPFWRFFEEVSSIPRASSHEGAVLAYVKRFADDRGLTWREDAVGNVVVERDGANGGEGAATVVIQGGAGRERMKLGLYPAFRTSVHVCTLAVLPMWVCISPGRRISTDTGRARCGRLGRNKYLA